MGCFMKNIFYHANTQLVYLPLAWVICVSRPDNENNKNAKLSINPGKYFNLGYTSYICMTN